MPLDRRGERRTRMLVRSPIRICWCPDTVLLTSLLVLPRIWTPLNATSKKVLTTELRDVWTEALRELAPDTGAYVNEVDPTEPNWKETFYGEHYQQLLNVKSKWDPSGVFWCTHCVGSDLWAQIGRYGIENGVGQNRVKLCAR